MSKFVSDQMWQTRIDLFEKSGQSLSYWCKENHIGFRSMRKHLTERIADLDKEMENDLPEAVDDVGTPETSGILPLILLDSVSEPPSNESCVQSDEVSSIAARFVVGATSIEIPETASTEGMLKIFQALEGLSCLKA